MSANKTSKAKAAVTAAAFAPIDATAEYAARVCDFSASYDDPEFVSRGVVLAACLSGEASYDTIKPFTDIPSDDDTQFIEYTPECDSRLDKFDGVEFGYKMIDNALDSKKPNPREEKE